MRHWHLGTIILAALVATGLWAGSAAPATASQEPPALLLIYDSSNSMWGALPDGSRKYEASRSAIADFLSKDLGARNIAFRAYGHRRKDDCRDSELVIPFQSAGEARSTIPSAVSALRPTGKTPITYSLRQGLDDFAGQSGDILLISDGIETCDADPCDLMRAWREANVSVRVHVVGVGLNDMERTAMACIADISGGRYFDADSADGFQDALTEAGAEIDQGAGTPTDTGTAYAIVIRAADETGRTYRATGRLFKDGVDLGRVVSAGYGRNVVSGAGTYEIEVGAMLRDGTAYQPVRLPVTVSDPGDTAVDVVVPAPARVAARFTQEGADTNGGFVRAYQGDQQVFGFRQSDEALARPGLYDFRATPNSDNELSVSATLTAGDLTTVEFSLIETVRVYIEFELPNGDTVQRASELWRDGEQVYKVHASNGATVRPGSYELRSEDAAAPLQPAQITIPAEDQKKLTVPLDVGYITVRYADAPFDYLRQPDRAWVKSADRSGSSYVRPGTAVMVAPGLYTIEGWSYAGVFAPLQIEVVSNQTVEAVLTPAPLGELVVTYAPSQTYATQPDRAFGSPLDGQAWLGANLKPGTPHKLLPGRYRIEGWRSAGTFTPQEVTVVAGQRAQVTLQPVAE